MAKTKCKRRAPALLFKECSHLFTHVFRALIQKRCIYIIIWQSLGNNNISIARIHLQWVALALNTQLSAFFSYIVPPVHYVLLMSNSLSISKGTGLDFINLKD